MRILFDQGTPTPLRQLLHGHAVSTAFERGWSTLKNGELLTAVELLGFEMLLTTDANLKYQQDLTHRRVAIVVLGTTSWTRIRASSEIIVAAINAATPRSYIEIAIP